MADAMAASSGGVDWSAILKPLLSPNRDTFNRTDLIELCSALVKSESEIFRNKETNRNFYNSFACLASNYIGSNSKNLTASQLETVSAGSQVLLRYLLNTLQLCASDTQQNCAQIERIINAVQVLCVGTGPLSRSEVILLLDIMKGENPPQHPNLTPTGNEKDASNKQESSKTRSDLSVSIFEHLTLPLRDGHVSSDQGGISAPVTSEAGPSNDPTSEINKLFLKTNSESLQALRAGDTLVDLCLSLPSIKRAKTKVEEALAGKPFSIPTNHSEATALRNGLSSNLTEIKLAMSALTLPVLEPLTTSKLDKLCNLTMAVLQCAVAQATASAVLAAVAQVSPKSAVQQQQQQSQQAQATVGLKEDDLDINAVALVEEALNMYAYVGNAIKSSTRAGGHIYQNYILAGAWVLVSGLQAHLTASTSSSSTTSSSSSSSLDKSREDKGRSPCKGATSGSSSVTISQTPRSSGLQKFQQSFGVLSVALATRALSLLSDLFDDLHLEACCGTTASSAQVQVEPAPLSVMGQFTALQRVARILGAAPLNQLLFYLAIVGYRKACTLKRLHPPEGDNFSQSDSTTYYEDMIICSDDSSTDDDDSEPILGQWFEETIAPPDPGDSKSPSTSDNVDSKRVTEGCAAMSGGEHNSSGNSIVPQKGEAHGYIALATNIFQFLDRHLLCSRSAYVARYVKNGLTEQQMIILAAIIRDLDKETSRTEVGTISVYFGAVLGQLYCEFSGALSRFTHNLITNSNLNGLQACLLNHLGVSPWTSDVQHGWPLQVYPRTLAVLAQVLLLRPQNEKEASVISIWHKFVNTLIENVLNCPPNVPDAEAEDLNVEHAQVLLYLFHSLNLMQKKSVVLLMAGGVLRCSEVVWCPMRDSQLLHLSRLLLLFDYIMKHLYDAPTSLLEQIHWNLFYATNLHAPAADKDKENNMTRMFTAWQDIEDNYRKIAATDDTAMKPRFYVLTNVEMSNQEVPKLDGLACNFVLGTPDKLRYPLLLDALVKILNVTYIRATGSQMSKMTFLGLCATQYCFTICWRLLQLLPPSVSYLERLAANESLSPCPLLLHSLIWGPRASNKHFSRWLKDCLGKQGMYTQLTEKLLKSVSDVVNNAKYDIANAKKCIVALTPDLKKGIVSKEDLPPLWNLILLDSLLAKVQVSLDELQQSESGGVNSATESTTPTISYSTEAAALVQDLLPYILRLTQAILQCTRWSLVHTVVEQSEAATKLNLHEFEGLQDMLSIASNKNMLTNSLASELTGLLPSGVASVQQQWNNSVLDDISLSAYRNDVIPSEGFILKIVDTHVSSLSMSCPFNINLSLKRLLQCLVKFICDHAPKIENTDTKNKAIEMLVSITLDLRTEYLYETASKTLDKMIGDIETDEHQKRVYLTVLDHTYRLIINCTSPNNANYSVNVDEKVLYNCLQFYEKIIEKSSGRQALEAFFTGADRDLVKVLMSVSSPQVSQQYSTRVLHLFNKLFQAADKSSTDPSLNYLCSSISKLANVEPEKLQTWLQHIIIGSSQGECSDNKLMNTSASGISSTSGKWTVTQQGNDENDEANQSTAIITVTPARPTSTTNEDQKSLVQENSQLLQALTSFIVKQNSNVSEEVAVTILKALIPLGLYILSPELEGAGFTDLMVVMTMLADAGTGKGHTLLFPATAEWIEICNDHPSTREALEKATAAAAESGDCAFLNKNALLEASCCILDYVSDVVASVTSLQTPTASAHQTSSGSFRALSPPWESEMPLDAETEWTEDANNEEEDSGDDSDEDSLCNKLCTFTVTQKEFMNQHWYHCHTCKMLDGVGVCSICARVCHKGHDLSYAKFGNFFCDCGAKEDGSCQALVKRSPQQNVGNDNASGSNIVAGLASSSVTSAFPGSTDHQQHMLTSSLRRRTSSPTFIDRVAYYGTAAAASAHHQRHHRHAKQLDGAREFLQHYLNKSGVTGALVRLADTLMGTVEATCGQNSAVGCHQRAVRALQRLHAADHDKKRIHTDQLMVPTLGSQEGAFENVRMSYAGEQGQTIRQLLSAHIVRRVAMCCMTSTQGGRRQHLAVSHEKGKITVLQLSALLKQADSSTRKLTLTRLASAPIPFTVVSLSANLCNEDFLAVCGLKDCHVLTFTSTGAVSDHLVLHPQLETGNFIIKAIWLPGSQTKLALVTADFVKIYDLSQDALSPQYYFLVPSGKIRDCTFMYNSGTYHILLMSSPGHIYTELLNEDSSAKHGSFYVTNTLDVFNLDLVDVNGQVAGGGVSIYYSHTLGLLFYSYSQGKSFISPINPNSTSLTVVYPITLPASSNTNSTTGSSGSTSSKNNGSRNPPSPQPLCQWTEIPNHPGLVCCAMQSTNNPVVLMLKPDALYIQEIRVVPSKAKIMDMVAIRHNSGSELRTTLILLCEDGSLKMFMASMEHTGFWMSANIQPSLAAATSAAGQRPKKKKTLKAGGGGGKTSNAVTFPVDFFEHCTAMNDVEIGGNDLLQVYNMAQLKHRLNTTGLYVACNRPLGFTVEITNNESTMVMTGVRVLVGSQDVQRVPSFVEVFGRIVSMSVTRSRWYDIPFSREESLQADKKLTILFGPSQDPETITMVDSIKVYGKTKDAFGWPEENEEAVTSANSTCAQVVNAPSTNDTEQQNAGVAPLSKLERLTVGILESLEGSFSLPSVPEEKLNVYRPRTLNIATRLLTLPTPPTVQIHAKALLSSLHTSKQAYHVYKDQALLQHVLSSLTAMVTASQTNLSNDDPQPRHDIDAESYYRLVLIVRGIAVARPQNLVKFADAHTSIQDVVIDDPLEPPTTKEPRTNNHLLLLLMDVLWTLHSQNPENPALAPVVVPGLKHAEQVVHALVEIVHAFNSCDTYSNVTIGVYLQLLLCSDPVIAFSAKQALCKVLKPRARRKRVFIPTPPPPHCFSPSTSKGEATTDDGKTTSAVSHSSQEDDNNHHNHQQQAQGSRGTNQYAVDVEAVEPIALLQQHHPHQQQHINPLEALLGGGVGFPPLLDIPPDADDETMVELAIALSLQEHEIGGEQGLQVQVMGNEGLGGAHQIQHAQEAGHLSDTTASAAGSDDEGSTAATDGSTLRTSPAEQGGSAAGSESGGSGVESIAGEHNVSGRSSTYGDNIQETITMVSRSDTSSLTNANCGATEVDQIHQQDDSDVTAESENSGRLHMLRLQLLDRLIRYLPKLRKVNGVRAIPFLQVVLQLTADLDGHSERDCMSLNTLLGAIVFELQISKPNLEDVCTRTQHREVQLILMRLLSVFMSRCKTSSSTASSVGGASSKPSTSTAIPTSSSNTDNCTFVCRTTATFLQRVDIIGYCNRLLQALLEYWKNDASSNDDIGGSTVGGNLLKEHLPHPPPDMTPFFLRQFVKEHAIDVFATYPQLLTEMALRLPYQAHKNSEISEPVNVAFDSSWYRYLCEYMMTTQTPFLRRQVRKLLLFICGNKEKYRQLRDLHALDAHVKGADQCCARGGYRKDVEAQHALSLPYDSLVELVEHLKACLEIATMRTGNWQRFCVHHDHVIPFLLRVSCLLDEGVAPTILGLLQCAIVHGTPSGAGLSSVPKRPTTSDNKQSTVSRKEREKSDDSAAEALFEESSCVALVEQINKQVSREIFARFVKTYMLETNTTSVRWQAHALVLAVYKNSKPAEQDSLLQLLWQLWPLLPAYGRKAAQFVDLLGYFSLKYSQINEGSEQVSDYVDKAVNVLRIQNELLAHHPNANLYAHMGQFVDLDGYYLESEPCLVCNNPEVPFSTIKLGSIKVDSKFTTTTTIVKLLSSHTISRITVRIGDLKRTKMVRTINIYYNNRTVQAVVELKNKPALWHKAKKVTLQSGQAEVKIEFPLPIVACNLMIEYADFYENFQASSETLQCPRCSASVPANPGVCANCGENVFQCHKCRAINYDEKDPFLCHACGFCKYAKFDFVLLARPCCAVEPIESDEDRKKTVSSINTLLEKADRVYKQLIANKPTLESLLLKISEHRSDGSRRLDEVSTSGTAGSGTGSNASSQPASAVTAAASVSNQLKVNKTIQMLAQQYCNDCKTSFEELSKIIQKVLVSRKELVAYDRKHRDIDMPVSAPLLKLHQQQQSEAKDESNTDVVCVNNRCYGCSSAATEHCLTLLRALATNAKTRQILCQRGLVQELVWNNLRKGSVQIQEEVRQLLCVLTRDNPMSTEELCSLLMERIRPSLSGHAPSVVDLGTGVRHEIALLAAMVQKEDDCWELKLRCMMGLFLKACDESRNPLIMESIILPCLKILQTLMRPPEANNIKKSVKEKTNGASSAASTSSAAATSRLNIVSGVTVDVNKWLAKEPDHTFAGWKARILNKIEGGMSLPNAKDEIRKYYLMEKYSRRWRKNIKRYICQRLELDNCAWIKSVLFNPSSRLARQVACNIVECLCNTPERKKEILVLLTYFLEELGAAGESSAEFLGLYQNLIQDSPWKQYLALQGVLNILARLVTKEIQELHRLEESTLTSDLAQGYALYQLTELLASFLDDTAIRRQYKGRLVGAVLNGYLALRRLVVQRTRLIDDTQEKLLELLEEMTTGTEEETRAFMAVCIETVNGCGPQDMLTPVFIFERLCSIIYPEENDVGEFYMTLEKDPQQEDFLQGRMLGNPYSSFEAGLGPLMRDVKNKICQDCELVALLEDDNGMELLVNNKIMSLDLPVRDVYKKVWLAEGGDHDAMRIVYRMRGLLGDATEEFVETLSSNKQSAVDDEEVYRMANVLADDCDGLDAMVQRLAAIQNVWRARPLLQVLLKLFRLSVKVNRCREVLIRPELGAMEVFLRTLQMCLEGGGAENQQQAAVITEQLLDIMETVLSRATAEPLDKFERLSHCTFGGPEYVRSLLKCCTSNTHSSNFVRQNRPVLVHLTRVLAALCYGNPAKMEILLDHFLPVLSDFNALDIDHTSDDQYRLEMFCVLTNGIEKNAIGNTLKDYIVSLNIVKDALEYITVHAPCVKPTLLRTDSDELKDFISKPSLKYILRFLTGLAHSHEKTQLAIASADTIPIIHRLEQVSSDEHVGSLAENLLEALCTNATVAKQIEEVREFTRSEKKRLAMAMREKQLGQLGMRTNDKGQVTAKSTILQQIEELGEESGLVCCICREGYKYQPTKVLGVYTFTKRCNVEDYESPCSGSSGSGSSSTKSSIGSQAQGGGRKTVGYTTVSHFNVVHIDCHMSAVRLARARDEWESAALQNANTKCNGLLPLWGPQVAESAFASCLARHNTYLQECTNHRDIGHQSAVHDLKLLLMRFAFERTFHEDTGGGGPQSNMHVVPYLVHVALYVINTTRVNKREESSLMNYLETSNTEKWVESAYEAEGPLYWATMSLLLHSLRQWNRHRLTHLRRFVVLAQARHLQRETNAAVSPILADKQVKPYAAYKPYLVFFALIDGIYNYFFKNVNGSDEQWPNNLADYIRHNDEALMKASEKLLSAYTDEFLPCTSFSEFCDVAGLLDVVSNPDSFISDILNGMP